MDRVGLCVASDVPSAGVQPVDGSYRNVVDPVRDTKCPDREEFVALCPDFVRTLVLNFDYFGALIDRCLPDTKVIACVNEETINPADGQPIGLEDLPQPDPSYEMGQWHNLTRWKEAVEALVTAYGDRLYAVEITNEWDANREVWIDPNDPSLGKVAVQAFPAKEIVRLIREIQVVLHSRSIRIVTGGAVTGPDAITELMNAFISDQQANPNDPLIVDGVGFHPYASSAGGIGNFPPIVSKVEEAYEKTLLAAPNSGYPLYVTEFGLSPSGAGGENQQAQFLTAAFQELLQLPETKLAVACWFSWSDQVGKPWEKGTRATASGRRPSRIQRTGMSG